MTASASPSSGGRRWLRAFITLFLLPTLIGAVVWMIGGRPLTYDLIRRAVAAKYSDVHGIGTAELARRVQRADRPVLLDARTGAEYGVSHLEGARRIDPSRPSLDALGGVPKSAAIVVYCSVGYRSAGVARWLTGQGFSNVRNLEGSLFRWVNEGRPVDQGGRRVARVHPYDRMWGLLLKPEYRADAGPVKGSFPAP